MQTNKNNKDNFRKAFREKLEPFEMSAPDRVWDRIEQTQGSIDRRRAMRSWLPRVAAVAAAVALLLLFFPLNQAEDPEQEIQEFLTETDIFQEQSELAEPVEATAQPLAQQRTVKQSALKTANSQPTPAVKEDSEPVQNLMTEQPAAENADNETAASSSTDFSVSKYDKNNNLFAENDIKIKKRKTKSIALSLGSGNSGFPTAESDNPLFAVLNDDFFAESPASFRASSKAEEWLDIEQFPESTCLPPISIGASMTAELSHGFSVEASLFYTFLRSNFRNPTLQRKAHLDLHYAGFGANLQYDLLHTRHSPWKIYLTGGGAVEKGILSHYVQENMFSRNELYTIRADEKIDGLQLSVSLGAGFDYRFIDRYSLFVEPRIGRWFDNDQPFSARTQHPVVFGINGGIRMILD